MTADVNLTEESIEEEIFKTQLLSEFDIRCIARQVQLGDAGRLDILGYSRWLRAWVIIEIKKDKLKPEAYTQLQRYMQYWMLVKQRPVYGVLIGRSLAHELRFVPKFSDFDPEWERCFHILYEPRLELDLNWWSTPSVHYRSSLLSAISANASEKQKTRDILPNAD